MASTPKLQIWWGSGSQPGKPSNPFPDYVKFELAWAVLIAAEEKKIPYISNLISFSKKEHKTEEFLARNPRGQVPTIQDGDVVVYESKAILHYLDVAYPENPLFPVDLKQRAIVEVIVI